MSIVVYNSQYKKADLKKAKFDELYVVFNGYEYKLSDKKFAETDKNGNKTEIKSVKQFESALKEGRLLFNNTKVKMNTDPKRTRGILFPPEYLTTLELPKDNTYVSDRINVGGEKNPIPMGLKRALVYREAYAKGERREQYVYLKIHGKSEMEFVPLKSIGYYEGMEFKSNLTLTALQKAIEKGNQIYLTDEFKNATVDEIYLETTFVFTEIKTTEVDGKDVPLVASIDTANRQIIDIVGEGNNITFAARPIRDFVTTSYERTGEFGIKAKKTRQQMRKERSELRKNFVANITSAFYENAGSVNSRIYEANQEGKGKYVVVTIAEDNRSVMVPIESLRELNGKGAIVDELLSFEDLSQLVGKQLVVDGQKTAPLTAEQALISYDLQKHLQQSARPEDRLDDEAYLELEDGSLEKEKDIVKPIGYKFVKDSETDFDVYIVTANTSTVGREIVVDKDTFLKNAQATVTIDGKKVVVSRADAVKAKRCPFASAQAVQTTSRGAQAEDCRLLVDKKDVKATWLAKKDEIRKSILDEFLKKYKAGEYELDGQVDVKDELIKLARERSDDCRYVMEDFVSQPDYANRVSEYANLMSTPLTWDGNKLVGGPQYDAKKAIKTDFSRMGIVFTHTLAFAIGWGGILAAMISPWIVGTFALGLAGAAIGMPIYRAIRNWYVERNLFSKKHWFSLRKKFEYKDKVEIQRAQTKKQIMKELSKAVANEKMQEELRLIDKDKKLSADEKKAKKDALKQRYKNRMLTRFTTLEVLALTLSTTQSGAAFVMKDGKGEVNEENAHLFSQYKTDMGKLQDDIKHLEKKKNRTKEEQIELDNKKAEFESKKKNAVVYGKDYPADPEYEKIVETLGRAKALCLAKYFGENPTVDELTDEELELLNSVELKVDKKHRRVIEKLKLSRKEKKADKQKNKDNRASSVFSKMREKFKNLKSAKTTPAAPKRKSKKSTKGATKGKTSSVPSATSEVVPVRKTPSKMTDKEIEDIIIKVRDAMEKLRALGDGNYGNLDPEEQETAEQLKEIYKDNKQVLKFLVEHRDYVKYRNLFSKYSSTLNTIKYTFDQYMTQVENANVNKL